MNFVVEKTISPVLSDYKSEKNYVGIFYAYHFIDV